MEADDVVQVQLGPVEPEVGGGLPYARARLVALDFTPTLFVGEVVASHSFSVRMRALTRDVEVAIGMTVAPPPVGTLAVVGGLCRGDSRADGDLSMRFGTVTAVCDVPELAGLSPDGRLAAMALAQSGWTRELSELARLAEVAVL